MGFMKIPFEKIGVYNDKDELITGKRILAHNGSDPGSSEPPIMRYYVWVDLKTIPVPDGGYCSITPTHMRLAPKRVFGRPAEPVAGR